MNEQEEPKLKAQFTPEIMEQFERRFRPPGIPQELLVGTEVKIVPGVIDGEEGTFILGYGADGEFLGGDFFTHQPTKEPFTQPQE